MLSEQSQWTQNTMFVDLDLLLNASSPLTASAELLVFNRGAIDVNRRQKRQVVE